MSVYLSFEQIPVAKAQHLPSVTMVVPSYTQPACLPEERYMHDSPQGRHQPYRSRRHFRETRALLWPMFILTLFTLFSRATALDDESHALSFASSRRQSFYWTHIGLCITLLLFIGQNFVALFGTLLEPSMGITSILWLMMRNDAAISPKMAWL